MSNTFKIELINKLVDLDVEVGPFNGTRRNAFKRKDSTGKPVREKKLKVKKADKITDFNKNEYLIITLPKSNSSIGAQISFDHSVVTDHIIYSVNSNGTHEMMIKIAHDLKEGIIDHVTGHICNPRVEQCQD